MKQLIDKVIARLFTRYPSLLNRWARKARIVRYSQTPWTSFTENPVKSRLALITTAGVHLKSEPPFDMRDRQGDPSFREIPADAKPADLSITHNYYDQRDAVRDINIVFPLERVRLLEQFGEIGKVNHRHFSFMGHISNRHLDTLINETAPGVAEKLRGDSVDIALLTPA
jgi:D-proline reductase (dithiol) PrdB